jgi:hypothetical protein
MRPLVPSLLIVTSIVAVSLAAAGGGEQPRRGFAVRSDAAGWTVFYEQRGFAPATVQIDGASYLHFSGPTASSPGDSGSPQLPVEVISLGLPEGAGIGVTLVDPVYQESGAVLVAPVPGYRATGEREAVAAYRIDRAAYSANRFFPGRELWADPPFTLRSQRIATIHLAPLQYNPATKVLRRLIKCTLRITITGGTPALPSLAAAPLPDPHFEDVYRSLIANYEQARAWRSPIPRPGRIADDPARDWFTPGRSYYRVPVADDGWYRVTRSDLLAAGAPAGSPDTATMALFFHGMAVPFCVRGDSSIEFYGERKRGDSTYLDFYTDTSAYWLTWGGTAGSRFAVAPGPAGAPGLDLVSANELVHIEENTDYYEGTGDPEITNTGPVPGEGWAWEYYYPGSQFAHTFSLDSLDSAVSTASVRVRLFSTTPNFATPNHRARFWINDSLAGEVTFNGRQEGMFTAAFPAGWLVPGTNTLRIQSDPPPGSPVNQFYLDWVELGYARLLRATGGHLVFTSPGSSGGVPARFTVSGFMSPSIEVYNLSNGRRITGGFVSGSPSAGYAIAFQDTFSSARRYAVIDSGSARQVLPVRSKVFSDIRANPQGADYIIIAHRDFLSAAQQLAAHRRVASGVRVAVVDVQDIYDEFNYGMLNVESIKAFLRHAYQQWAAPAPAALLLLGDASWDYHRYMATTIKTNYVPAYGVPAGDNWFGCFDSLYNFLPSLLIGRIPAQDPLQADRTVAKIIGYESEAPAEWTKSFLFISGGTTPGEQISFNASCDATINQHVVPPPIGGFAYRVYKTTPNTIDGENKQLLRDIVKKGIGFLNFLGHSGGRIWGVDIGSPNELENTNGALPFVTSVSCNVGAFAEPSNNVLSEDFILADNRGAVGVWSSSSLGYASVGSALVNYLFVGAKTGSLRGFGALTTTSRFKLWQGFGSDYITVASVNLNPLLGDPLSRLALPLKPDLAVSPADIAVSGTVPSPIDTAIAVGLTIHNYGLVPSDSVTVSLTDLYEGQTTPILNNVKVAPTRFKDSLSVQWNGTSKIGMHTFRATLDPAGVIAEVTKANNSAALDQYVYANLLAIIRPLRNMVVPPGSQILRVSGPIGADSANMQVVFELDTLPDFSSPFLISSPGVMPGPVSAEWTTPSLAEGMTCFWRARTVTGALLGAWTTSSFTVSTVAPALPLVRWRESSRRQFAGEVLDQASATDSGVTIVGATTPMRVFAQSLGYRADANRDYYSVVGVNEQIMSGYWWIHGSGFLAVRLDESTGTRTFGSFDVPGVPGQADSMLSFLNAAAAGNYIALSVIFDGSSNVSPGLRSAISALGSVYIDSLQPGHAWSMIARKGASGGPLSEHWSAAGTTRDSIEVANYFSRTSGSITSIPLPMPHRWDAFRWSGTGPAGTTNRRAKILGVRTTGIADSLWSIPQDSAAASLQGLNTLTADPAYVAFRVGGVLTSQDVLVTPVLKEWSADFEPPADLAVSSRTIGVPIIVVPSKTASGMISLGIFNIGYRRSDSARVFLSILEANNARRPVAAAMCDSIPPGGNRSVQLEFAIGGLPRQFTVEARVTPAGNAKDLVQENNVAFYDFQMTGNEDKLAAQVRVFSDGVQLMDGDYVAANPRILVQLNNLVNPGVTPPQVDLLVDNLPVAAPAQSVNAELRKAGGGAAEAEEFAPALSRGTHELKVRISQVNAVGGVDTVVHRVTVNVTDEYRIMQLYNFPNPFDRETWFSFVLTGARPADELAIRIFTVTGRLIREIGVPAGSMQIGFNRVHWDGRDAEGDEIANGYYFYKVVVKGNDKTVTALGKLVKAR